MDINNVLRILKNGAEKPKDDLNDYTKGKRDGQVQAYSHAWTLVKGSSTGVLNCVYVVTERDNYGEQLFKGVFANREKAVKYLYEAGLKESNIIEINEIDLD